MEISSEKVHLQRLQNGDITSFEWIYRTYHPRVYGFCLKLVAEPQLAEEITVDVFVKIWEKRAKINVDLPIKHLLFKITRDYIWNQLKKQSKRTDQEEQYLSSRTHFTPPKVESDMILQDYLDYAEHAINKLPEKRRLVFLLHYKTGLNNQEIAQKLNISETTVRVHLSKAIKFLRDSFQSNQEIVFAVLLLFENQF